MKKIIWAIVFVLLATNIYSLGIAPAKTTFDFEPNTVKEGYFRIITDEAPVKVVFTKEKELGYYIELEIDVMILEWKKRRFPVTALSPVTGPSMDEQSLCFPRILPFLGGH